MYETMEDLCAALKANAHAKLPFSQKDKMHIMNTLLKHYIANGGKDRYIRLSKQLYWTEQYLTPVDNQWLAYVGLLVAMGDPTMLLELGLMKKPRAPRKARRISEDIASDPGVGSLDDFDRHMVEGTGSDDDEGGWD